MPFKPGQPGGPGRPRTAVKHAGPIAKAEKQIADRLPSLIENLFILADGVTVEEDGIVYRRPPDRQANEYLINRILGKPTERQEVSGVDGGPITLAPVDYRAGLDALKPDDADT